MPADQPRGAAAGFTLIEVLIVVAILALVGGLVLSRGPMRSRSLEARAEAADIARILRGARGDAIAGDRPVRVVVDGARRAVAEDGGRVHPVAANLTLTVQAAPALTRGRVAAFVFQPDGSASGGSITLADGRHRIAIAIDWLTGRIRLAEASS